MWQIVLTLLLPPDLWIKGAPGTLPQKAIVTVLSGPRFENRHNCEVYVARVVLKDTDMTDVSVACLKARK